MSRKSVRFVSLAAVCLLFAIGTWILVRTGDQGPRVPEIGRGLPEDIEAGEREFARRVSERYSSPLIEDQLIADLEDQGFDVIEHQRLAQFERAGIICTLIWRVSWTSQAAQASQVTGTYGTTCP